MKLLRLMLVACFAGFALAGSPATRPAVFKLKADAPENVRAFHSASLKAAVAEAKKCRETAVASRKELALVRAGRVDSRAEKPVLYRGAWTFPAYKDKAAMVAEIQARVDAMDAEIEALERPGAIGKMPMCGDGSGWEPVVVGRIGWIEGVRVRQVISDDQVLAEIAYDHSERINQKVGREFVSHVVTNRKYTDGMMFSGVRTAGMADNQYAKLDGVFIVVGTYRYETVLGVTRTVLELKPFKWDDHVEGLGK